MIATLSISLPTAGAGGQLVVRHHERERIIDMTASEPSELAFAAFYADCEHEVTPVTEGHRLSLVFNLCLGAGDTDTPRTAPDYSREVDRLATRLAEWGRAPDAAEKLAWVLEHEYSEAGLSFDALKNRDAALARILAAAGERAECALHAAILHLDEWGSAEYTVTGGGWGWYEPDDDAVEMGEVEDYSQRLDINHVTERRGRPFTLVCTKNRASHRRRLAEYTQDVACMRLHRHPGLAAGVGQSDHGHDHARIVVIRPLTGRRPCQSTAMQQQEPAPSSSWVGGGRRSK